MRATASDTTSPTLDLDFTTASLDARIAASGGANGTRTDSTGAIVAATAPRFDYNPSTLAIKGLLIEPAATNLLLNATIDGANLATQNVTVTATAHVLSFYGTGTITLSGASTSGPLVGSGAYPTRSILTFTPSAGTLTLTVTGTVQYAQLEVSANTNGATSFIPTAGAAVTRTRDALTMPTTGWYSGSNHTLAVDVLTAYTQSQGFIISLGSGHPAFKRVGGNVLQTEMDSTLGVIGNCGALTNNVVGKLASAFKTSDNASSLNGAAVVTSNAATDSTGSTTLYFGSRFNGTDAYAGCLRRVRYYPRRATNTELQAFTA